MAKESPVYRGDDPGFQTQAVGNYPDKSDVADKDNIYLSDQGWVYRHFTSLDKSTFWDEIIWAGDVTNPPTANDPVDTFGADNPEFLTGDGFQFVSGPYPGVDPTIGEATIGGFENVDTATAIPYTVSVAGTLANNNTYAWSVDGPGTATFSSGTQTGTFTGNTPAEANVSITFPEAGQYTVTCLIKSSAVSTSGSIGNLGVSAEVSVAPDTIGTVTVTGQATPEVGNAIVYTVQHDGTAPDGDLTLTFTTSPTSNRTIADTSDPMKKTVTFTDGSQGEAYTLTASLADPDASDTPQSGTKSVTPHTVMGNATALINGEGQISMVKSTTTAAIALTYTGTSNPAPSDLTYSWRANPSGAGTFSDDAIANPTFTAGNTAGGTQIVCTISSADSDPSSEDSSVIFVTITDS